MMGATLLILLLSVPARGLQLPQNPATIFRSFLYRDPGNGAAGFRHQHCDSADWTGTRIVDQYN